MEILRNFLQKIANNNFPYYIMPIAFHIVTGFKQIKIDLYLPDSNELKQYNHLEPTIEQIVVQIIGEIAYRKPIISSNSAIDYI